ncbi:DUF4153 domain-containing protein [Nocardia sp. NPDC004722]
MPENPETQPRFPDPSPEDPALKADSPATPPESPSAAATSDAEASDAAAVQADGEFAPAPAGAWPAPPVARDPQTSYAAYLAERSAARPQPTADYPSAPRPPYIPRADLVSLPGGLLAATVGSGVAAAVLVPVDRPGVGWLLAGLTVAGAVYTVDRAARRRIVTRTDHDAVSGSDSPTESDTRTTGSASRHGVGGGGRGRGGARRPRRAAPVEGSGAATTKRSGSRRLRWERAWWAVLALGLLGVGAVRDAPWLFGLCVVGAAVAGSLAVVPRSAHGLWFDVVAVPFAAVISPPWLYRAVRGARGRLGGGSQRVWWSVAVAAALLLIMVPLLSGADAVFAGLVDGLLPQVDVPAVVRWGAVFVVGALGTAGALYLLAGPPPRHDEDRTDAEDADGADGEAGADFLMESDPLGWLVIRRFSTVEWGIPVAALTLVFAVFVGTQIAVLFGGDGYVQRTAGLTYAEYARSGFWQLSIVSMLTLAVIGAVLRFARQSASVERRWLRVAVATVCGLTLVIVASALGRMWTYQQAYGFTVMRLLVEVFEGWIALVYVLVLASLVRLRRGWVPRAAVGAAAATLLGLAMLNPEGIVAERNIDRWQAGKTLDTEYLGTLSADVLPAADGLPGPQRAAIANVIRARLSEDPWQGWNYARATGR